MVDYVRDFLLEPKEDVVLGTEAQGPMNYSPIPDGYFDKIDNTLSKFNDAMAARDSLNAVSNVAPVPSVPPQEANLKQAELDLQEAQELDKQSGSDGYEARPDGIFDRLKGFGASIIGKQGPQEWQDFKNDFGQRGIGAFTQRANNLMNDMARSPFSNFVDPTTVLGGQRTMVNDIDKYFATRGIPGLKNDLLAQQKLNTELEKTPVGQFKTYEGWSPERQAAYRQFRADTKGSTGTQGGYKTLQAQAVDFPRVLEEQLGYKPSLSEIESAWGQISPVPYRDALQKPTGTGAGGIPTNPKALAIREGLQNYEANPEAYPRGWTQAVAESWNKLPASMRQTTYQPQTPEEKLEVARLLKGQELDVKSFDELATEVRSNAKNAAMNAEYGRSMHRVLDEAAKNGIKVTGGGDLGKALRRFGANFGLVDSTTGQIISNAEVISNAIFGNQIAQVIENQNRGNITERERELFARQAVDLGASEEAMRLRLDLYILYNELALQASKKLNSLSTIADPIARKQAFESWQTAQYDKTAKLVRAIVDSHMGAGYFDNKEAAY